MFLKVFNKLEIAFWDFIIYALDEIQPVRLIVQKSYLFFERSDLHKILSTTVIVGLAGFCFGIGAFIVVIVMG